MPYKIEKIKPIAEKVRAKLAPYCIKCEIGGSIRRNKKQVKDIEIICIPKAIGKRRNSKWCNIVFQLGKILKGKIKDGKYIQIRLPEGVKLDLFMAEKDNWGMAFLIRTGSNYFNIRILSAFSKLGFKSVGNYPTKGDDQLCLRSEKEIFDYLEMDFVEPKNRK